MSLTFREAGDPQSENLLVLLHGFGANEMDLLELGNEIDPSLKVVAFRAPLTLGWGSYAWYQIGFEPDGTRVYSTDETLVAREMVISELETLRPKFKKLFLAGFSQGAILSLGTALARPDLMDAILLWSGALNPEFTPETPSKAFLEQPKLIQHGTLDPVLSIAEGRRIRDYLTKHGAEQKYTEYPMAHQISLDSIAESRDFLSTTLSVHSGS